MERQHASHAFDQELNEVREKLITMGGVVESMITDAVTALVERDDRLADAVIARDHTVNGYEVSIDEKCLEILARRQPAARDLRFITLALKIVTDLERIGDQCTNFAKRVKELNQEPPLKPYIDIPRMARLASEMVTRALDAFVRSDDAIAVTVCEDDQRVDDLLQQVQRELFTFMIEDPKTISRALKLLYVSKSLERMADHATNIAEMVVFMVKGKDIRHTIA
ncbi:MAG: phosphate signaling complex protein PhoU [Desulfuromonadia bacterium]